MCCMNRSFLNNVLLLATSVTCQSISQQLYTRHTVQRPTSGWRQHTTRRVDFDFRPSSHLHLISVSCPTHVIHTSSQSSTAILWKLGSLRTIRRPCCDPQKTSPQHTQVQSLYQTAKAGYRRQPGKGDLLPSVSASLCHTDYRCHTKCAPDGESLPEHS